MTISEYYKAGGGFAQVRRSQESKEFFIVYFDEKGNVFNTEKFPGKSIHYVEDAAENWSLGIKKDSFISGVGTNSDALAGNHNARRGNVGVSRPDLDAIEAGDV